jgi:Transposase IS4
LKPVFTGPLPEAIGFDETHLPELPTYKLTLDLQFQQSKSLATGQTELEIFQQLLTPAIVNRIFDATNSYAANACETACKNAESTLYIRHWKPVNSTDIWRYIGCLLYLGSHIERKHKEHWRKHGYLSSFPA